MVDVVLELIKATRYLNEGFDIDQSIDLDNLSSSQGNYRLLLLR
jgi:hypothetical protein